MKRAAITVSGSVYSIRDIEEPEVDYTEMVEEYNPWRENVLISDNPLYMTADHYEPMQTEIAEGTPSANVSFIAVPQRYRKAYQINSSTGFALASLLFNWTLN